MAKRSTHDFTPDPRNENVLIYINGEIVPRSEAKISVFDSGFLLGDGVWEGIRLHNGHLVFLKAHLNRLYAGARAIDLDIGKTPEEIEKIVFKTLKANKMVSDVHLRLIISRGLKRTPFQHPGANVGVATIVVIPEYKIPDQGIKEKGISLYTVHVRRGTADIQDPKWNTLSKLNCITACIQADKAGADEALMLDIHGFVSTCNSTNFFIVCQDSVWTSTGDYCLNGVTRGAIIDICHEQQIPVFEKNFSLVEVYDADEAFVTGTFAGVIPVVEIDGRTLSGSKKGPLTHRLQQLYSQKIQTLYPPE
ncbi:MAG: aminotransferase class IV [Fidelibacterota bacterium]